MKTISMQLLCFITPTANTPKTKKMQPGILGARCTSEYTINILSAFGDF